MLFYQRPNFFKPIRERGIVSAAVVFLHSYTYPKHEQIVSASSFVVPPQLV